MSSPHDPWQGIQAGRQELPRQPFDDDDDALILRRRVRRYIPWTGLGICLGLVALLMVLGAGFFLLRSARMAAMQAALAQAQAVQAQAVAEQQALQAEQLIAEGERLQQEHRGEKRLERNPVAVEPVGAKIALPRGRADRQGQMKASGVSLTLVRVQGEEYASIHQEGPFKGQKVRNVRFDCDVVLDNQTGEALTVLSPCSSAYDGLSLVILRDGQKILEQSYLLHQSPMAQPRAYPLEKGKNEAQLRFPIGPIGEDWTRWQVKLVGTLPGSKWQKPLESNSVAVQKMPEK